MTGIILYIIKTPSASAVIPSAGRGELQKLCWLGIYYKPSFIDKIFIFIEFWSEKGRKKTESVEPVNASELLSCIYYLTLASSICLNCCYFLCSTITGG